MSRRNFPDILKRSEGGLREAPEEHSASYVRRLARYIRDPSTIRVRALEQYSTVPPLDGIRMIMAEVAAEQSMFRDACASFAEVERPDYQVRGLVRPANPPARRGPPIIISAAPRSSRPVTGPEVVAAVARDCGVSVESIKGAKRTRKIMLARRIAAYVLRQRGNSFPEVGRHLGGKDHGSMIHAVREFERCATPAMREIAARYTTREAA